MNQPYSRKWWRWKINEEIIAFSDVQHQLLPWSYFLLPPILAQTFKLMPKKAYENTFFISWFFAVECDKISAYHLDIWYDMKISCKCTTLVFWIKRESIIRVFLFQSLSCLLNYMRINRQNVWQIFTFNRVKLQLVCLESEYPFNISLYLSSFTNIY